MLHRFAIQEPQKHAKHLPGIEVPCLVRVRENAGIIDKPQTAGDSGGFSHPEFKLTTNHPGFNMIQHSQWPFQGPKLEVPTIYKAYFSGLCKGISQQNMALYGTNVPPSIGS